MTLTGSSWVGAYRVMYVVEDDIITIERVDLVV